LFGTQLSIRQTLSTHSVKSRNTRKRQDLQQRWSIQAWPEVI